MLCSCRLPYPSHSPVLSWLSSSPFTFVDNTVNTGVEGGNRFVGERNSSTAAAPAVAALPLCQNCRAQRQLAAVSWRCSSCREFCSPALSYFPLVQSRESGGCGGNWRLTPSIMGTWRILAAVMLVSSLQTKRPAEVWAPEDCPCLTIH
jgi:hypothetical protein